MSYSLPIATGSPLYAIQLTEAVINTSWAEAEQQMANLSAAVANAGASFIDPDNPAEMIASVLTPATVTEPTVAIPSALQASDVIASFDSEQTALVAALVTKFTSFRSSFFPNEQTTYASGEQWLSDAIANPAAGIPASLASQLLSDDKDRILADASRASAEAIATFAGRRYPLPPGAAAAVAVDIGQKAQSEIAASSRKLATLAIENTRFAVDKVLSLRQEAMSAALDYVKTMAFGMDQAGKVVDGGYAAQSRLVSAAASYYGARATAKELEFKGTQSNAQMAQEAGKANLQSALTTMEARLKSLLVEAETIGRAATALYNNLHAQAGASASFSETQAT